MRDECDELSERAKENREGEERRERNKTELPDTRGNRKRSDRALDGPRSSKRIGEIVPDNMTEQNGLRHAMSCSREKEIPEWSLTADP